MDHPVEVCAVDLEGVGEVDELGPLVGDAPLVGGHVRAAVVQRLDGGEGVLGAAEVGDDLDGREEAAHLAQGPHAVAVPLGPVGERVVVDVGRPALGHHAQPLHRGGEWD